MNSDQVQPQSFVHALTAAGVELFAGVPDSLLQDLCGYLQDHLPDDRHLTTANEGNAVAVAMGYHIATGRSAAVYLQNSGLGNTVNPLLSLADPEVYRVPMLLVIGWRGEPGTTDEPQHLAQGRLTLPLLDTLGLPYAVLDPQRWTEQVADVLTAMERDSRPAALVVRKGFFAGYTAAPPVSELPLRREDVLERVLAAAGAEAIMVSTTGKTSREVFEIRERRGEGHERDFLTVGGMGHASSIALGMSLGSSRTVYCLDGDGAFLMHLGALPVAAQHAPDGFRYLVINNGAHESVGGQSTVAANVDLAEILRAAGFTQVETVSAAAQLPAALERLRVTPRAALVVNVAQGSRAELGRPSIAPERNKQDMMRAFAARSSP